MADKGLAGFIHELDRHGQLVRIKEPVSTRLEITEITDRLSKLSGGGPALLFENNSTPFPVLINGFGSEQRIKLAFGGKSPEELIGMIRQLLESLTKSPDGLSGKLAMLPQLSRIASWMPRKVKGRGACQEVVMNDPDLSILPVLTCWPHDGGPFITLPMVHTTDPDHGIRNVGMYRIQLFSKNQTGMHWQLHKTGARHYRKYKEAGKMMPVAVTLGGDPVYTYAATAPLPDGIDEYLLAGFIRQKPVNLVKCLTQEMWVPEDADIVIEGYVDPAEPLRTEGPFGDHTGFYSLEDEYPVFHVTAITHRKGAIYPATIVGIPPMEDTWLAWATEKIFFPAIKLSMMPELEDLHMPDPGVAHNLALLKIQPEYPGHARKIIHTVWGAGQMMFTKYAIITSGDIGQLHYRSLIQDISDRVDPAMHIERGFGPLDVLDHAAREAFLGGKLGIDVTGELLPEEIRMPVTPDSTSLSSFRSIHPELTGWNLEWIHQGISVGLVTIRKGRPGIIRELAGEIRLTEGLNRIRFWVFYDDGVDLTDPHQLVWLIGSHTDPAYDAWIFLSPDSLQPGLLFLDATRKNQLLDGFQRPWPNPVLMNMETIQRIDGLWSKLGLGGFISSPSLKYRHLNSGNGAIAT